MFFLIIVKGTVMNSTFELASDIQNIVTESVIQNS